MKTTKLTYYVMERATFGLPNVPPVDPLVFNFFGMLEGFELVARMECIKRDLCGRYIVTGIFIEFPL